jgi:hypothetical protein
MRIIRILATLMLLVMMGAPAVAHDSAEDQKIVTWAMPTPAGGWSAIPTASTATWPQTLATGRECGGWNQVDVYRYSDGFKAQVDAILADGILTKTNGVPEDSKVVVTWRFVAQPDCEPVIPGEPEGSVLVADYMNTPTCEEPTVLAGSVTTTTTWAFDRITWTWVSTVNVVDTREEVSLTAAESEACNPVMPPETPPSIAPPAIQSPTAPPATLVHVTPLFAG